MSMTSSNKIMWGALLILFIVYIVHNQIREKYLQEDPMLHKLKQKCSVLHEDFKNVNLYKGDKSYTLNKEKIYLCLRDENGEYYPDNTLMHVLLHEYAHFLNKKDIGHTENFHRIFEELIEKATQLEIYNPSIPIIQNYCTYND